MDLSKLSKADLIKLLQSKEEPEPPKKRGRKKKEPTVSKDFIVTINKKENRKRVNPETGLEEGVYTKSEPVRANTKFYSGDDLYKEDAEKFDKKVKHSRSPRRTECKKIKMTCDTCKKEYSVSPILAANKEIYFCDKCIIKKSRS
jgi:hypothetical protein